jgi:hypothetical protein
MSVAFTILVAGDEDARVVRNDKHRASHETATPPKSPGTGMGEAISEKAGFGNTEPPSRTSLAVLAYPGLVGRARRFNVHIKIILGLLITWLICTCLLSWNVAAGKAILAKLNDVQIAQTANNKKIEDAEVAEVKQQAAIAAARQAPAGNAAEVDKPGQQARPAPGVSAPVLRYCDRPLLLPPRQAEGKTLRQFDDVTQRQVCDEREEIERRRSSSNRDLASWVSWWDWINAFCGTSCQQAAATAAGGPPGARNQWAAVLVEVLAGAVLPVCYGILGAGAAVVRRLWGNMKDSLLLPRDVTLALGQLALGAVIGACIGLFIAPSGNDPQSAAGLTTAVTLTPSALSFIAGFGVESVFVTLESLIRRIFNIPDDKAPQPAKASVANAAPPARLVQ